MGVITDRSEMMENIYAAYGYTVYARSGIYHWTAGVTNRTKDNIYTEIDIKDPAEKTLKNTCLADLRYKNLKYVKGDTVGIIDSWSNTNVTYMKREMTLYFI